MIAPSPRFDRYDSKMHEALDQAFDATWAVLRTRDPFRDLERDEELRTVLSQKLTALAADGVTDPIELREWALESLLLR